MLETLIEKNINCYALSNWSAETWIGMLDDYPFLKKFDGIVISGQEKVMKPDEKIYQIAIDRYELISYETIFIDDNLDNIKAAKNLGLPQDEVAVLSTGIIGVEQPMALIRAAAQSGFSKKLSALSMAKKTTRYWSIHLCSATAISKSDH